MNITIQGHIGEGKSTVAQLIREALHSYGIDFTIDDEEQVTGWHVDNPQRLNALSGKNLHVNIKTCSSGAPPLKFNLYQAAMVLAVEEVEDLRNGRKISCIKRYRDRTGAGLIEAKNAVEEFQL